MTKRKFHKPFQMRQKLSTMDDLDGSLRTIVAKRYVVGGGDGTVG